MPRLILAAALTTLAAAALADQAMLNIVADGMVAAQSPLAQGYAICLLGGGTVDGIDARLRDRGFLREDEPDMGAVYFDSSEVPFSIGLYENGTICDVTSEEIGTDQAMMGLVVVATMTGYQMNTGTDCPTLALTGGVTAEVTSSGNDPVCSHPTTSNVRFTFGAAAAAPAETPAPPAVTKAADRLRG